jgi:hypothetical protein
MRFLIRIGIVLAMSQALVAEPQASYRFLSRATLADRDFVATTKYAVLLNRFPEKFFLNDRLERHIKRFGESVRKLAIGLREPIERDVLRAFVEAQDTLKRLRPSFAEQDESVRSMFASAEKLREKLDAAYARKRMALSPEQSIRLSLLRMQLEIEQLVVNRLARSRFGEKAKRDHFFTEVLDRFEADLATVEAYAYWNENDRAHLQQIRIRWQNMRNVFVSDAYPMLTALAGINLSEAVERLNAQAGRR